MVYFDQMLHTNACQHYLTTGMCTDSFFFMVEGLLNFISAGYRQLMKMLLNLEPHCIFVWNKIPADTLCVQFSFCFLRLQFYFVNYVIVSCELPYYNSFDQRMMLKN